MYRMVIHTVVHTQSSLIFRLRLVLTITITYFKVTVIWLQPAFLKKVIG